MNKAAIGALLGLHGWLACVVTASAVEVERFQTLEMTFNQAIVTPANPFETYLLRLEVTDPSGRTFELDGFYDGDGLGGQLGNTWKARINAYGVIIRAQDTLPHIDEEFGILVGTSDDRLRGNLWSNLMSGAAGGGTGSDLMALQQFLQQSRLPFQQMTPGNNLVSGGAVNRFALAQSGHHYLVYSTGGSFDLDLSGTGLAAHWFNPRDPAAELDAPFAVFPGNNTFTPPADAGQDWVLWVTDGVGVNDAVTHPSAGADLARKVIAGESRYELVAVAAWEFNTDGDREGWQSNTGASDSGVSDGSWQLVTSGFDPSLFGPAIAEDADVATIVEFQMSSTDSDVNAQLFWTVASEGFFSELRSQRFTLIPDGELHTYQLELSGDSDWSGTISRLRFDPVATSHGGTVSIDSIRLLTAVAVPEPTSAGLISIAGLILAMCNHAKQRTCRGWPSRYPIDLAYALCIRRNQCIEARRQR